MSTTSSPEIGRSPGHGPRSGPSAWLREPLVHFIALAAVIVAAQSLFVPDAREMIYVSAAMAESVEQQHATLLGRPLTDEERVEALETFIEDEVLIREARRMGIDNDSRVRQHLSMKMRAILDVDRPDPTPTQLREMYDSEPQRSVTPQRFTVRLAEASSGATNDDLLEALRRSDEDGSEDPAQRTLPRYTRLDIERAFGPDLAKSVSTSPPGQWLGPIETPRGRYAYHVSARYPSRRLEFEEIETNLRQEWHFEQRRAEIRRSTEALLGSYRIVIEPREADP